MSSPPLQVLVDDLHVRFRVPSSAPEPASTVSVLSRRLTGRTSSVVVRAVRGVSLVARQGESIGVLGRNGSGKSTLLRAIAGLTTPDRGQVLATSRPVLLGVNATLLPDLSGSRNVVLGALAMGLSREEANERYQDVVDLADLGDAIHLPMRTYSSGMQSRLRFAIATVLRPEILLIDEALNTGDAEFRARSQERINELRGGAGTVFLVSHSLATVLETCTRAIWLDEGQVKMDGEVRSVTRAYRNYFNAVQRARRSGGTPPPPPWVDGTLPPTPSPRIVTAPTRGLRVSGARHARR